MGIWYTHLAVLDPEKKAVWTAYFPYEICNPKQFKPFSHWLSEYIWYIKSNLRPKNLHLHPKNLHLHPNCNHVSYTVSQLVLEIRFLNHHPLSSMQGTALSTIDIYLVTLSSKIAMPFRIQANYQSQGMIQEYTGHIRLGFFLPWPLVLGVRVANNVVRLLLDRLSESLGEATWNFRWIFGPKPGNPEDWTSVRACKCLSQIPNHSFRDTTTNFIPMGCMNLGKLL